MQTPGSAEHPFCRKCHYQIEFADGVTKGPCPECGHAIDLTNPYTLWSPRSPARIARVHMRSTGLLFLASWLIPVGICCWYLSMPGGDFLASIVFVLWVGLYCIIWVGRFLVAIAVGLFYRCAGKVARQPGWYLVPLLAGALSALATRVDWPAARMWWYRNDLNALAEVGAGTHDSVRVPTVVSALGGTHGGANPNGGKIAGMTVRSVQAAHEISEDWNIHRTGPEGIAMLRSLSQSKGFVLWLHDPGAFWDEIGLIYIPEEDLRGECARSWRSLGNGWYQIRRVD